MIKHKNVSEDRRGIYCPMPSEGGDARCCGAACAWWVDDDEERGHCAALDWGTRIEASRKDAPSGRVNAYVPCPVPDYDWRGQF